MCAVTNRCGRIMLVPHALLCDWSQLQLINQHCLIAHDYKTFQMKWPRLLCEPFGMSVRHFKGKVALTLV